MRDINQLIAEECDAIKSMLIAKNNAYGNAAADPLNIFSKLDTVDKINVRMDDKLSRISRGDGSGNEDAELDLIGYLLLKRVVLKANYENGANSKR